MIGYKNIYSRVFEGKKRNGDSEFLATLFSGTTVSILLRTPQNVLEAYKVGHWKCSQLKFFIIGQDATIKEEEGRNWHGRICFQPIPTPLPHHLTEVPQQGQFFLSFLNGYIGKGVE